MTKLILFSESGNSLTKLFPIFINPSITVYSQDGDVFVKSDAPVRSVAVYDIAGKLLKEAEGGNFIFKNFSTKV